MKLYQLVLPQRQHLADKFWEGIQASVSCVTERQVQEGRRFTRQDIAASPDAAILDQVDDFQQKHAGHFGCTWGHREIHKAFIASGEEWALVAEDDATLVKPERLQEALSHICLSPSYYAAIIQLHNNVVPHNPFHQKYRLTQPGSDMKFMVSTTMGIWATTLYALNRRAALQWVKHQTPMRRIFVDVPMRCPAWLHPDFKVTLYRPIWEDGKQPDIVWTGGEPSLITGQDPAHPNEPRPGA